MFIHFQCPIVIPVIVLLASIYLVFAPIIDAPDILYLYATLFMFGGTFLYFPFVVYKKTIPGFSKYIPITIATLCEFPRLLTNLNKYKNTS